MVKKELGDDLTCSLSGNTRNASFSMEYLDSLGWVLDGDHHDQMLFPRQELEDDISILTKQKSDPSIGDYSTRFHHFGSTSGSSPNHFLDKNCSNLHCFPSVASSNKCDLQLKTSVPQTRHKHWTKDEDEILRSATLASGTTNWGCISRTYFNCSRSATQCRHRWQKVSSERMIVNEF